MADVLSSSSFVILCMSARKRDSKPAPQPGRDRLESTKGRGQWAGQVASSTAPFFKVGQICVRSLNLAETTEP